MPTLTSRLPVRAAAAEGLRPAMMEDFLAELTVTDIAVKALAPAGGDLVPLAGGSGDAFVLIIEGNWQCRFGALAYDTPAGTLVHVGPEENCQFVVSRGALPARGLLIRYQARISESIAFSEILEFPAALTLGDHSQARHYLTEIAHLPRIAPFCQQQCLRSLMMLTLVALVRDELGATQLTLTRPRVVRVRRLLPAVRALRRSLYAPPSVESFAHSCGLSVAQFRRLFHMVFQQSPTQYIQQMRIREACRLLQYTDCTVSEICSQIGYEQPSHFHKMFKKTTGVTPRYYRNQKVRTEAVIVQLERSQLGSHTPVAYEFSTSEVPAVARRPMEESRPVFTRGPLAS